jgi:uncharacterized protein YjiS (DUF1127 family)
MTQSNTQQVVSENAAPTFVNGVILDILKGTVNAIQEDSDYNPYNEEVTVSSKIHAFLAEASRALPTWKQRVKQRNALTELSSRLLADVGISEGQRFAEINKPFWRT